MDQKTAIINYCSYQDRCHKEVRNKLYDLGCNTPLVESLISELIEMDLLNEERYAISFARGKFRIKKWGKIKIVHHLKQHQISDYCIRKALKEINQEEYYETIKDLCTKKWNEIKNKDRSSYSRRSKTYRYLLQKGFENDIINDIINEISQVED